MQDTTTDGKVYLEVWPKNASTGTPEFWNFRTHCMMLHDQRHGPENFNNSGVRDIMEAELMQAGGLHIENTSERIVYTFRSAQHRTMWLLKWGTPL